MQEQNTNYLNSLALSDDQIMIGNIDRRIQRSSPHQSIGVIIFGINEQMAPMATGNLVDKLFLVTSAHIFFGRTKEQLQNIYFFPGIYGPAEKSKGIRIINYKVKNQYSKANNQLKNKLVKQAQPIYLTNKRKYDYALCKLQRPVQRNQYFQLRSYGHLQAKKIEIYGYPASKIDIIKTKSKKKQFIFRQFGHSCLSSQFFQEEGQLHYKVDTSPGQSGSLILSEIYGKVYAIGIHNSSSHLNKSPKNNQQSNFYNEGILFSQSNILQILIWQGEMGEGIKISLGLPTFQWNKTNDYFHVHDKCAKMIVNKGLQQLTGLHPLPKLQNQVIKLQIKTYAQPGQVGICIGIITETEKNNKWSGKDKKQQQQSIGYWTNNKLQKGEIYILGKKQKNGCHECFVKKEGVLAMELNRISKTITFTNETTNYKKTFSLSPNFFQKQLYVFVVMNNIGDSVVMLQ